jgi:hypothetical protein
MTDKDLFKTQLHDGLMMVTRNYFDDIVKMEAVSAAPPKDTDAINLTNYKKTFETCPVLKWGTDNCFPNNIDAEALQSSVFEGAMKVLCDHMRGQNLSLALPTYKNGKLTLEEVEDKEVMQELEDIGYFEYWYDACGELPKWGNVWPLFGLNEAREIKRIKVYDAMHTRLERPAPGSGAIENIYVSAQWANNIDKDFVKGKIPATLKGWIQKFPLLSRQNYVAEMAVLKSSWMAAHIKFHTSGSNYGRAPWHSLYINRWLGISGKVPTMLMRYYEAAMTINYLIYMNQDFLEKQLSYKENWTEEEKAQKVKEIQQSYEKNLKGSDNAFKSLMFSFKADGMGNTVKNVMIETLDNKMREGSFIPDSQLSDGQILFALGIAPALLGAVVPGSKGGEGGSGSNIREASLALQMRLRPDRELVYTAFYMWRDYNFRKLGKTDPRRNYQLIVKDYAINTLDGRAPSAAQETTPTA